MSSADRIELAPVTARDRWSACTGAVRSLLAVATVLIVVALVLGAVAARSAPVRRIHTVTVTPSGAPADVDAGGCPTGAQCTVRSSARDLTAVVDAAFPVSRITASTDTVSVRTGHVYRRVVLAEARGAADTEPVILQITAQCVPGAHALAGHTYRSGQYYPELDGSTGQLSAAIHVLVPGSTGCSVAVLAQAVALSRVLIAAVQKLAADPALQVSQ